MQRVGVHHRSREIVDHQVLGHPAEEGPSRLQPGDDVLQSLSLQRPDEAVPGVAQHYDHGPHRPASSRGRVRHHAETPEISLGHLARRTVLHPHRGPAWLAPVPFQNESPQRRIRGRTAADSQQLLDARHLQPVAGEPTVDLVSPRLQRVLPRRTRLPRPRLTDTGQPAQLFLSGRRPVLGDPHRLGRSHVLSHRLPGQAGARRDLPQAVSCLPTAYDFLYLHSGNLPVRHRCAPRVRSAAMIVDSAPRVAQ